ncbi:MAG TPA: MaoC/PaaZ C-terminal domain-containing protein [Candidatus Baltobacteraceae bacterium]|jgi:acyl dehydratase|nr:MaoC/PaaZ C-terminal domain-containing protein [Candidatus Baltobacteraceae bacterium]
MSREIDHRWLLERNYSELKIGDRQLCRGRTITEADIVMWCSLTGDWFYVHVDKVAAERDSIFKQRVAPGMMIWAFGGGLGVPAHSRTIVANYGAEKIRFSRPVFIGDTIRLELEIVGKTEKKPGSGVVDVGWNLFNQNDEAVCLSVVKVLMQDI